jgi:threonine 3-dehydrogenase
MKAVKKVNPGRGGVVLSTESIPEAGPDDVVIKVTTAGICGTDLHIYKWDKWSENRIKPPVIIGHEFVGEVYSTGENVKHLIKGQRVTAEGHIACGHCRFCRNGKGHICKDVKIIGVDRNGCFAEYVSMPASNIWPVSKDIPDKYAAVFDPLGNAMHTVMIEPVAFKDVLITGAGTIGLFSIPIAKANGANKVIVVEPNLMKRNLAHELGADLVLDPSESDIKDKILNFTEGYGPEILLEMSGNNSVLDLGLDVISNGGSVSLLGINGGDVTLNLSERVIFKGIALHGITGRKMYQTWYQCESFLKNHAADIDPIITHCIDMDDINEGFLMMEANKAIKVLLKVN